MQIFSRNWLSVAWKLVARNWPVIVWKWLDAHRKTRAFLLGVFLSSVLFGCPINYTPFASGIVVDAKTGEPIKDVSVRYILSQFKETLAAQQTFTREDGSYMLPMKLFVSILPSGYSSIGAFHPLYESGRYDDLNYDLVRPLKFGCRFDFRVSRLRDKAASDSLAYELNRRINSFSGWSVPNSTMNADAIKKELVEIATQNKIPHNSNDVPNLLDVLKNSKIPEARSIAVEYFEKNQVKESLPYLKECVVKDSNHNVRENCRNAVWEITGEMPSEFVPEDAERLGNILNAPGISGFVVKLKNDDPGKKQYIAQKEALEKYKAAHPKK